METQTGGRPSVPLTPALGLGVLVLIVVFAFDSAWYPHWYAFFRVIHVTAAVFWVGGGMLLTALAIRAERANDAGDLAALVEIAVVPRSGAVVRVPEEFSVRTVRMVPVDLSSTSVRAALERGEDPKGLLPEAVVRSVLAHRLYSP